MVVSAFMQPTTVRSYWCMSPCATSIQGLMLLVHEKFLGANCYRRSGCSYSVSSRNRNWPFCLFQSASCSCCMLCCNLYMDALLELFSYSVTAYAFSVGSVPFVHLCQSDRWVGRFLFQTTPTRQWTPSTFPAIEVDSLRK